MRTHNFVYEYQKVSDEVCVFLCTWSTIYHTTWLHIRKYYNYHSCCRPIDPYSITSNTIDSFRRGSTLTSRSTLLADLLTLPLDTTATLCIERKIYSSYSELEVILESQTKHL